MEHYHYYDKSRTAINEVKLSEMELVQTGPISIEPLTPKTSLVSVPGMDGSLDLSLRRTPVITACNPFFERRKVSVPLAAAGTLSDVNLKKSYIMHLVGNEIDLYDARYNGYWRGIMSMGEWTDRQESWDGLHVSTGTMTIDADPFLYDAEIVDIEITKSPFTYYLGMDYKGKVRDPTMWHESPVYPRFILTPTGTSKTIGIKVELSDGSLSLGSVSYASDKAITTGVAVNCASGTIVSDGKLLPVSINDDFPYLIPSAMKITLIGCSKAEMIYEPRILI